MATKAKVDEFNMGDDIVTEFTDTESTGALASSDLATMSFNDTQDEEERKRLFPPAGDWLKVDEFDSSDPEFRSDDCQLGDISPKGRMILSFMGKPEARYNSTGDEFQPTLFIRISPDRRYKIDKPSEVDLAYKMFLRAKDLYLEIKGEKPVNPEELRVMLASESYTIRTMQGDSGPFCLDIKPNRKAR